MGMRVPSWTVDLCHKIPYNGRLISNLRILLSTGSWVTVDSVACSDPIAMQVL